MRTRRWGVLAAGAVLALVAGAIAASAGSNLPGPTTIHVFEHANTDRVIDTGRPGDTSGDLLTFHNPVFNASNTNQVGRDQGQCAREAPKRGTWECMWTTFLPGGQITVEGPVSDTKDSVLAITGGTGRFSNARGEMELKALRDHTRYVFVFHLEN